MPLNMTNHTGNMSILMHKTLPMIKTGEFDFFRCVQFDESFYGKTISFRKLSLREVRLNLGELKWKNRAKIVCSTSCDYTPCLSAYGEMFMPLAKVKMDLNYLSSDEYALRFDVIHHKVKRMAGE